MRNTRRVARALLAVTTPAMLLFGAASSKASAPTRQIEVTTNGFLAAWHYEPVCPEGAESGDVLVHVYQHNELVGTTTSGFECGQSAFIAVDDPGFKAGRAVVVYMLRFFDEPTLAQEDATVEESVLLRRTS